MQTPYAHAKYAQYTQAIIANHDIDAIIALELKG